MKEITVEIVKEEPLTKSKTPIIGSLDLQVKNKSKKEHFKKMIKQSIMPSEI